MIRPTRLSVEHLAEPLGLHTPRPRFSWVIDAPCTHGVRQVAYELELRAEDGWSVTTGRVDSDASVLVEVLDADLAPATGYAWRVRVWTTLGAEPSPWASAWFETSITDGSWSPVWVEPAQSPVTPEPKVAMAELAGGEPVERVPVAERLHPVKLLRQGFVVDSPVVSARLRATAQGIYAAELNGAVVGDEVLAPGYESYQHYLSFQTYDVTALVGVGENVLGVQLADGWWAGRISITGTSGQYGDRLRAAWRLELTFADGTASVVESGPEVRSSEDGPIRYADLFIGEGRDARREVPGWSAPGFDDAGWTPVRVVDVATPVRPFAGEPVRRVLELPAVGVLTTPRGETVVDVGQVIAGRLRLRVRGEAGTRITLEHSEVLDADGNFFNNIQGQNKDQTDVYLLAGDPAGEEWEPLFTFHGFRYVRVTGYPGAPRPDDFTAVVLASDLPQTSGWSSSDPRIDQLHRNTIWSQRGNLLSVPTDCPQRERVGWTGDIQVFGPTAAANMGVAAFLQRWLANVRADQDAAGGLVPIIVPMPPQMTSFADAIADDTPDGVFDIRAAAGWGDVITMLPHALHRHYGDVAFLADNYDAMRAWVALQSEQCALLPPRLAGMPLDEGRRARQGLLWNGVMNFGDWLTPSLSDSADPATIVHAPLRTAEVVGAMFHGHSLQLTADAARVLGYEADAERYGVWAERVREAFAFEYLDESGRLADDLQGPYVLALALGFVPQDRREGALGELVRLIHANGDRLDTGFLSVPYLLDVLVDGGERELAWRLLWQAECPSWLYAVDRGATTMWESWDGVKPDGTVGANSFNHFAFGSVDGFLLRRLAGLQIAEPGFRRSRIAPDLDAPLDAVSAWLDTAYGRLTCSWRRVGAGCVELDVAVPANASAVVELPGGWAIEGGAGELGSGEYRFVARLGG